MKVRIKIYALGKEEKKMKNPKTTTLDKLKKGQSGVVIEINIEDRKRKKHLLDMGLTRGVNVKVKKIAPMGDPISIELRGYELCISKKELAQIRVMQMMKK